MQTKIITTRDFIIPQFALHNGRVSLLETKKSKKNKKNAVFFKSTVDRHDSHVYFPAVR